MDGWMEGWLDGWMNRLICDTTAHANQAVKLMGSRSPTYSPHRHVENNCKNTKK